MPTGVPVLLYNVGADLYFTKGNSYGTQGSLAEEGMEVLLEKVMVDDVWDGESYIIKTENGTDELFTEGSECYVDRSGRQRDYYWAFKKQDNGAWRIQFSNANTYGHTKDNYPDWYLGKYSDNGGTAIYCNINISDAAQIDWEVIDIYGDITEPVIAGGKLIRLPNSVEGDYVVDGSVITSIGARAFYGCDQLTSITLPEEWKDGNMDFAWVTNIPAIPVVSYCDIVYNRALYFVAADAAECTIPNTCKEIRATAFSSCGYLTDLYVKSYQVITPDEGAIAALPARVKVHVYTELLDKYKQVWGSGLSYVTMDAPDFGEVDGLDFANDGWTKSGNTWTSTNHASSSTSSLTAIANIKEGATINFNWTVDSEDGCERLELWWNGNLYLQESGEGRTGTFSHTFGEAGTGTLKICYTKDGSVDSGSDCATVADIQTTGITSMQTLEMDGWTMLVSGSNATLIATTKTGDVVMPESFDILGKTYTVTAFGSDVFKSKSGITSVVLPSTITNIPDRAFADCSDLQEVTIPDNVTELGDNVFSAWNTPYVIANQTICQDNCLICVDKTATSFVVPEGITDICKNAFRSCSMLEEVTISRIVTSVSNSYTFKDCTSLKKINYLSKYVPWGWGDMFDGVDRSQVTVAVYESLKDKFNDEWGTEFQYEYIDNPETFAYTVNIENEDEAGSLYDLLRNAEFEDGKTLYDLGSLKVTGYVTSRDISTLRELSCGAYSLSDIDLSEAVIVGDDVKSVGGFEGAEWLKTIIIPQNTEYILSNAFSNCSSLASIDIPESVKYIGYRAFSNCRQLESVTGMKGLIDPCSEDFAPIYNNDYYNYRNGQIFTNCNKLTEPICAGNILLYMPQSYSGSYEIPEGVSMIAGRTFWYCNSLSSVTIPASVKKIGHNAFYYNTSLSEVKSKAIVPPTCGNEVFYGVNMNTCSLCVDGSAIDAYKEASGWSNFTRVIKDVDATELVALAVNVETAGCITDALDAAASEAGVADMALVAELTITGSINEADLRYLMSLPSTLYYLNKLDMSGAAISDYASLGSELGRNSMYSELALPEGIETIEYGAFSQNTRLKQITFPASLVTIDHQAFSNTGLTSVVIPDNVTDLRQAFGSIQSLKSIDFGKGVTFNQGYICSGSNNLETITIRGNVSEMRWNTFYATNLKDIYCYSKRPPLTNGTFYGERSKATTVHVYDNCVARYEAADEWCDFTIVGDLGTLPAGIELAIEVGDNEDFETALHRVMDEKDVEDESLIERIIVKGIITTNDIEYIRDLSQGTNSLAYLDLKDAETDFSQLPWDALQNTMLEEVMLPESITEIGGYAFLGCRYLTSIKLSSKMTRIYWEAFRNCSSLTAIEIPATVTYMGWSAFHGCSNLTSVTGGESITQLEGANFFRGCNKLEQTIMFGNCLVNIPASTNEYVVTDNVGKIVCGALNNAANLKALTLNESINALGNNCFEGLGALADIYYPTTSLPTLEEYTFSGFDRSKCTLHVHPELEDIFKSHAEWGQFNVVGDLDPIGGSLGQMDEDEYLALCSMYNTMGGDGWKSKWAIDKNVLLPAAWDGVTFDGGHVTAIVMNDNNLTGDISELELNLPRLTKLNLMDNNLTGDISTLANSLPALKVLNLQNNKLTEVSALLNKSIEYADVYGQNLNMDLGDYTVQQLLDATADDFPSILFYNHSDQKFNDCICDNGTMWLCAANENGDMDWEKGEIGIDSWNARTYSPLKIASGDKLIIRQDYSWYNEESGRYNGNSHNLFTFTYNFDMGDANMDDDFNVLDLQAIVNCSNRRNNIWDWGISEDGFDGLFNYTAANTYVSDDEDDEINVQDIVATVNLLLGISYDDAQAARVRRVKSRGEAEAVVSIENGNIVLNTLRPVAAMDIRISGASPSQIEWHTDAMGFATASAAQDEGTHAIIYSMNEAEIPVGRTVIGRIKAQGAVVAGAVLSDVKAKAISVGSSLATGIDGLDADNAADIYSIDGRKMNTAVKGVNIVRTGDGVKKVIKK